MIKFSKFILKSAFGKWWKLKLISVFTLFFVLFMDPIAFFDTIYGSHCIVQLVFSFFFFIVLSVKKF